MNALTAKLTADIVRPVNVEAELALIGACLVNNDAFRKVSAIVDPDSFSEAVHTEIWHVLASLLEKGQVATPVTMMPFLRHCEFPGMTAAGYLARLVGGATTVVNAPFYARSVRDAHLKRRLIGLGETIARNASNAPVEVTIEALFADLESGLEEIRPSFTQEGGDFQDFERVSSQEVYAAYERGAGLSGLPTGLPKLDAILGGLQRSDVIVVGGRPGSGKTAISTNIGVSVARHIQERERAGERLGCVGFFSLEMSSEQLKTRILSDMSGVPFWKLKRGLASREEMQRYVNADREQRRLPLKIDKSGGQTIAQVKMKARSLKRRCGLALIIVDYLQLLKGSHRHNSRQEEVTEISSGLKEMAKELDVPVIAVAQISRDVDKRDDRRPKLGDLRESGSIEQDADVVVFVYRHEYYLKDEAPRDQGGDAYLRWQAEMRKWSGVAEAIVAKNRHGGGGTVVLGFEGEFTRFTNEPAPREIDPQEVRERTKSAPRMSVNATVLFGVLRTLTMHHGLAVTTEQRAADRRLPKGARLLPLDAARAAYGREVLPGEDEAKVQADFRNSFKGLYKAGVAFYHGTEETGYFVWLPEMAADY